MQILTLCKFASIIDSVESFGCPYGFFISVQVNYRQKSVYFVSLIDFSR